ncbi:MAG: hypothetical protein LBB11_01975 [Puniceicoccales bacterium]|jgi:hypothetical protein|nr:hypothetical protein [Puniceicoccales bacterium]
MIPKEIATINPKFMKFIAKMGNFNDVNEPQELLQVLISPIMQRLAYVTIVDKDIHECIERNSIDELEEVLQNLESIIKSKENFFSQNDILSWLQSAIQNNDMLSLALFIVHKIYIPDCEVSKPCDDPIISYAFNQEKTDIHCFLEKIFWQLKPNEGSSKLPESGSDLVQKFSYFPLIEGRKDTINALKRNIRFARELCSDFGQPNHLSYII